jgi:hypothetical protein
MPAVSEEELQQLRQDNEKLREKIASAATKQADNDSARQREYEALQLVAENTRLEAELNAATERAKVDNSRSGAANVLEAAQAQLEAAQAQGEQLAGVPVDTNAENQPKNTTGATVAVEGAKVETSPEGITTVVVPDADANKNGGNS